MRVVHVSIADGGGGADIAARRLHLAERAAGIDSRMLVLRRVTDAPGVSVPLGPARRLGVRAVRAFAKRAGAALLRGGPGMLSFGLAPSGLGRAVALSGADIVHLHWVGGETMSLGEVAGLGRPLVWTLHDTWPVSGAEHYRSGAPGSRGRLDALVWARKRRLWGALAPALVCPSRWIAGEAAAVSPFGPGTRIEVIPNTLDPEVFRPVDDRRRARARLGLPPDEPVLLFGARSSATDPRKGFDLLLAALERLAGDGVSLTLAVFGAAPGADRIAGLPVVWLGQVAGEAALARAYAAADAFAAPSRQDNFPNTVLEAQFCGTPAAAFAIGGLPEMVIPGETGALAEPFDPASLAAAIRSALAIGREGRAAIRRRAVERFAPAAIAARHAALYECLMRDGTGGA